MKKFIIGIAASLTSIILFGMTFIGSAIYSTTLTSWRTDAGKFGTALIDIGMIPIIISVILIGSGIYFIVTEMKGE
ncbi:hypothetical protein [Lentibacillus sediminis]|uniref:hypothetical protein n=1 Tax=Lentibacillus sediminis TaxID=1940529 RepID=UPI000C1C1176|nr:hypothetical protein [Lentibacillus sediminis]